MPNHLDLFSGIGGFALAAKWAGFNTVQFCEIDKFCQKVLNKNFPGIPIHDDIKTFQYKDNIDLITAGFPCQPFSIAGRKKGSLDERYLLPEFFRIIREVKPNWIIIENVYGLLSMEFDNIIIDLEKEGFSAEPFILPACAVNAPHRRDRIWIIAYCDSVGSDRRLRAWCKRYFQKDQVRNLEEIQQEWEKCKPNTWKTYTVNDWLHYNTGIMRRNNGISERLDKNRIKSLGNAIVPQAIYPILKLIYEIGRIRNGC